MIELKRFVERVVRPVPSPDVWRKVRMREELYAHLLDAYEHELSLTDDETEAQRRAIARMGDPKQLTEDLCATVSWVDRGSFAINRYFYRRHGEAFGEWSLRVTRGMAGIMAFATLIPVVAKCNDIFAWTTEGQIVIRMMLSLAVCFTAGVYLLMLLAELVMRYLSDPISKVKYILVAGVITTLSLAVMLPLGVAVHVITSWNLTELSAGFWSCLPPALAGAAISVGVNIANALENRASAPWLELEIDG